MLLPGSAVVARRAESYRLPGREFGLAGSGAEFVVLGENRSVRSVLWRKAEKQPGTAVAWQLPFGPGFSTASASFIWNMEGPSVRYEVPPAQYI